MNLVIEIGNTSCGCALFADEDPIATFRIGTHPHQSTSHYHTQLQQQLAHAGINAQHITHAFIGSVVPSLTPVIAAAVEKVTEVHAHIINAHSALNITVRPKNIDELGCDIIFNLAEMWHRHPQQAAIVVDFGTALTVSALNSSGIICGVAIAPSTTVALQSLVSSTAQLCTIPLEIPPAYMGTTTTTALQSGIMHGYCGLLTHLLRGFVTELRPPVRIVATGGNNAQLRTRIPEIAEYIPDLTVRGLLHIGVRTILQRP